MISRLVPGTSARWKIVRLTGAGWTGEGCGCALSDSAIANVMSAVQSTIVLNMLPSLHCHKTGAAPTIDPRRRLHSTTSSARASVMKSRRSDAHLLFRGLRRRLPRDEFPALWCFCPGVEEHEPQAARLAVDLRLDRGATGDERGVAHETHLAI